jgi:hypothetical protein
MSGGICVVVVGGLLEDILEVAEGLDGGFVHVGGAFDCLVLVQTPLLPR